MTTADTIHVELETSCLPSAGCNVWCRVSVEQYVAYIVLVMLLRLCLLLLLLPVLLLLQLLAVVQCLVLVLCLLFVLLLLLVMTAVCGCPHLLKLKLCCTPVVPTALWLRLQFSR
jgi:hypothetical protein